MQEKSKFKHVSKFFKLSHCQVSYILLSLLLWQLHPKFQHSTISNILVVNKRMTLQIDCLPIDGGLLDVGIAVRVIIGNHCQRSYIHIGNITT